MRDEQSNYWLFVVTVTTSWVSSTIERVGFSFLFINRDEEISRSKPWSYDASPPWIWMQANQLRFHRSSHSSHAFAASPVVAAQFQTMLLAWFFLETRSQTREYEFVSSVEAQRRSFSLVVVYEGLPCQNGARKSFGFISLAIPI